MRLHQFLLFSALLVAFSAMGQKKSTAQKPWFDAIEIHQGNRLFTWETHQVSVNKSQQLAFEFDRSKETYQFKIFPRKPFYHFAILPSEVFKIKDSVLFVNDEYYSFKLSFNDLINDKNLELYFEWQQDSLGPKKTVALPLIAVATTTADFYPSSNELFLGEIQRFELESTQHENLVMDGLWQTGEDFNYRLAMEDDKHYIFIEPKKTGERVFQVALPVHRPVLDSLGQLSYELPAVTKTFAVKSSRFPFVRMVEREVIRDPNQIVKVEVTLENNRYVKLNQVYRVEASEVANSPIIAELLPLRRLSNDKILCEFRPLNNHSINRGFLYVKDGTNLLFLTNIDIRPKPSLKKVLLLKNGSDWSQELNVKPGERFTLRVEGGFLKTATFLFPELTQFKDDTTQVADNVRLFHLQAPITIEQSRVNVIMNGEASSIDIQIQEHQTPRPLDFIEVDYGVGLINIATINQPILFPRTVSDVVIRFDRKKIDAAEQFYGKQHIRVRVRMEDKNGALIETATLGPFWGCPDESALRYAFYATANCRLDEIRINDFLNRKTTVVQEWGRIEITFEHVSTSYATEGYSKRIVIYNQRRATFDVDVSIPAGLFVQKIGADQDLASLTGISFAMVAQFSFYRKNEIQQVLPYKIGAGFLAQNTFNFQPDATRDLGLVILGSVYPVKTGRKISFPLYVGGGYFLQEGKFFVLVGPGIRITL